MFHFGIKFYLLTHWAVCICGIVFWNWIMVAAGHILLCFVHWKNNRKLCCFSDWYSFVNGLQGWQTMDKMASLQPHGRMSLLASKQNKSNLLASKNPPLLPSVFSTHPPPPHLAPSTLQACERDAQCGLGLCCAVSLWLRGLRMCAPRGLEGDECHPFSHKVGAPHRDTHTDAHAHTHKHTQTVRRYQVLTGLLIFNEAADNCRGYWSSPHRSGQSQPYITRITWKQQVLLTLYQSFTSDFKKNSCFPTSGALPRQKTASHLPLPAPLGVHTVRGQQV